VAPFGHSGITAITSVGEMNAERFRIGSQHSKEQGATITVIEIPLFLSDRHSDDGTSRWLSRPTEPDPTRKGERNNHLMTHEVVGAGQGTTVG
jgi:hypothetical protein